MENPDLKETEMSDIAMDFQANTTEENLLIFEDYGLENSTNENYSEDDMSSKMDHLMHSDTMILVAGMVVMIFVGLVFRSICLRLSSKNDRKDLMRGGLKEMARHMDYVTRAMSNDLELPDSPRSVIRTYSNYGGKVPPSENLSSESGPIRNTLRVHAFTNSLRHDMENKESDGHDQSDPIEMEKRQRNIHGQNISIEMGNICKEER